MILLASRGRPDSLARFFARGKPKFPGIVILDDDDPQLMNYAAIDLPENWSRIVLPKTSVVASVNRVAADLLRNSTVPFIGWMADDVIPETPDWDAKLAELCGLDGVSYPEDGLHGHCTHFFVGGALACELFEKEGWFVPPCLKHLFFDTFWEDLAGDLGVLRKAENVICRHMHFSAPGGQYDRTYAERQTKGDADAYAKFKREDYKRIVEEMPI